MQLYRIKKGKNTCYVTPMQYIEYKRKGREIISKLESRPNWTKEERDKSHKKDTDFYSYRAREKGKSTLKTS